MMKMARSIDTMVRTVSMSESVIGRMLMENDVVVADEVGDDDDADDGDDDAIGMHTIDRSNGFYLICSD